LKKLLIILLAALLLGALFACGNGTESESAPPSAAPSGVVSGVPSGTPTDTPPDSSDEPSVSPSGTPSDVSAPPSAEPSDEPPTPTPTPDEIVFDRQVLWQHLEGYWAENFLDPLLPERVFWLEAARLVYVESASGLQYVLSPGGENGIEWWRIVGKSDPEYGWISGDEGAGVDLETGIFLITEAVLQEWLLPVSGLEYINDSVKVLGALAGADEFGSRYKNQVVLYAEAKMPSDGEMTPPTRLLIFADFSDVDSVLWSLYLYNSGSGWSYPEG